MKNQATLLPLPADLPAFQDALNHLGSVPLVAYQCLEKGASKTASYRDAECPNERLDDGLAAGILRFHTLRELKGMGIEAREDEDWSLDWLPFLGISFHYNGYHVRILKGSGGCLPGCGTSERKKSFYSQISTMYLVGNKPARTTANLLLLWDFDAAYGLAGLWLALPAVAGVRAGEVSAFWVEKLPHPTEGLQGVDPPLTPPADDLDGLLIPLSDEESARKAK